MTQRFNIDRDSEDWRKEFGRAKDIQQQLPQWRQATVLAAKRIETGEEDIEVIAFDFVLTKRGAKLLAWLSTLERAQQHDTLVFHGGIDPEKTAEIIDLVAQIPTAVTQAMLTYTFRRSFSVDNDPTIVAILHRMLDEVQYLPAASQQRWVPLLHILVKKLENTQEFIELRQQKFRDLLSQENRDA